MLLQDFQINHVQEKISQTLGIEHRIVTTHLAEMLVKTNRTWQTTNEQYIDETQNIRYEMTKFLGFWTGGAPFDNDTVFRTSYSPGDVLVLKSGADLYRTRLCRWGSESWFSFDCERLPLIVKLPFLSMIPRAVEKKMVREIGKSRKLPRDVEGVMSKFLGGKSTR
jgi:hypothetical protein